MFHSVMVWKFVITTSSEGIIISARNAVKSRFFPANSIRAKAKAARIVTKTISAVVMTVKITVLSRYRPRSTSVKTCT